ncbi:class I SAM-dependent DNA methyltransferase [Microbacterium sp.]|uniref:class I SAM-dependent DNA methyltransferase n=1 Tax=Microbacterium sp. TaxID=51671 RepID=UPI0039E39A3C
MDDEDVPSDLWTEVQADTYDDATDGPFSPAVIERTSSFLAELAGSGPALEFAIGTGRIAIPLSGKGVAVQGIEYSEAMANVLRRKTTGIPVVIGDMATTEVDGDFTLVYLVFNTIGNLYTQQAQVQCFRNAAKHLRPGGRFVVEVGVPPLRSLPPGQSAVPFAVAEDHVGLDTFDLSTQRAVSHHYLRRADGAFRYAPHNYRYVWPSELDLMGQLAGLELEARYADWDRAPFDSESTSHVSVWRKPG